MPARRVRRHRPQLARGGSLTRRGPAAAGGIRRGGRGPADHGQADREQDDEQHRVDGERPRSAAPVTVLTRGPGDHQDDQRRPDQRSTDRCACAGQHGVDQQLEHRRAACRARRRPTAGRRSRRTASPPTKTSASCGQQRRRRAVRPGPSRATRTRLRVSACAGARSAVDIDGKAITTTNCGRNSTALVRISPPAYRPASCSVEHVAGDDDVDVGEREEGEQRLGVVDASHAGSPGGAVLARRAGRARGRGAGRTSRSTTGDERRRASTPSIALVSVGDHSISAVPSTQPRDAGGEVDQRRARSSAARPAGCRPGRPSSVSGTAATAIRAAVARLSSRSSALISGLRATRSSSAERERAAVGDARGCRCSIWCDVVGVGGDPPRGGRLQAELQHRDDQQRGHQRRRRRRRPRARAGGPRSS